LPRIRTGARERNCPSCLRLWRMIQLLESQAHGLPNPNHSDSFVNAFNMKDGAIAAADDRRVRSIQVLIEVLVFRLPPHLAVRELKKGPSVPKSTKCALDLVLENDGHESTAPKRSSKRGVALR
jgi:hypothetical protein